jgi:protein SCO1
MTALKYIRYAAWAAIVVLGGLAAMAAFGLHPGGTQVAQLPLSASIGGPFSLTSHDGSRVTDRDLRGKPFALFFGFTNCPDVCPTTLLELTNRMDDLGRDADKMRLVFVSVDPARDTPEFLKRYIANFDKRTLGLTGTEDEIAAIAKAYRAVYRRVATSDGYTMDHTATVYLMDANGRFVGTIAYQEAADIQRQKLKRLVTGG